MKTEHAAIVWFFAVCAVCCTTTAKAEAAESKLRFSCASRMTADFDRDTNAARQALRTVEAALAAGETKNLLRYLHSKVFLTLLSGESGYYSAEQSFYILRNFFSSHNSIMFSWSGTNLSTDSAWGAGTLRYLKRGQRGTAQVFVSLVRGEQGWRINQLTIAQR